MPSRFIDKELIEWCDKNWQIIYPKEDKKHSDGYRLLLAGKMQTGTSRWSFEQYVVKELNTDELITGERIVGLTDLSRYDSEYNKSLASSLPLILRLSATKNLNTPVKANKFDDTVRNSDVSAWKDLRSRSPEQVDKVFALFNEEERIRIVRDIVTDTNPGELKKVLTPLVAQVDIDKLHTYLNEDFAGIIRSGKNPSSKKNITHKAKLDALQTMFPSKVVKEVLPKLPSDAELKGRLVELTVQWLNKETHGTKMTLAEERTCLYVIGNYPEEAEKRGVLALALFAKKADMVELCHERGMNIDGYYNYQQVKTTLLHLAAEQGDSAMTEVLLNAGAKAKKNSLGKYPMDMVIEKVSKIQNTQEQSLINGKAKGLAKVIVALIGTGESEETKKTMNRYVNNEVINYPVARDIGNAIIKAALAKVKAVELTVPQDVEEIAIELDLL